MKFIEYLRTEIENINLHFKGTNLNHIQKITSNDIVFGFSKNKNVSLIISLNQTLPFVKICDQKITLNDESYFVQQLKTKLINAFFVEAKILNNDNIVSFNFVKTTDTYDKIPYSLVVELFKNTANIILVSNEKTVIALRYRDLNTNRPIMPNMIYELPQKQEFAKEISDENIKNIDNYIENLEPLFLKEKYKFVTTHLKRKRKTLSSKLEKLYTEVENAKNNQKYKDFGDIIKMNLYEIKKGDSETQFEGTKVPLKIELTPTENLQRYYKLYKKSKTTLDMIQGYIDSTKNDIEYIDNILNTTTYFNEEDFLELIDELKKAKYINIKEKVQNKKQQKAIKPYFITYEGVRIGYGKNNVQNNELTFNIANNKCWFLHINKTHGPHVIIFDEDPKDSIIQLAAEIAVYLSNNTDGDVIFASKSSIKKGSKMGIVKLEKYETYHIKVRGNIKQILSESERF